MRHYYTPEEDAVIAELYPDGGARPCAERLGVSLSSVYARADQLGVKSNRVKVRGHASDWGYEDDRAALLALRQVCNRTGRSPMAVIRHLECLIRKYKQTQREAGK